MTPDSNENPSLKLVDQPLNPDNYNSWSRAMCPALSTKKKLGFIDGTIKMPKVDDTLYSAWEHVRL